MKIKKTTRQYYTLFLRFATFFILKFKVVMKDARIKQNLYYIILFLGKKHDYEKTSTDNSQRTTDISL